MSIKFVLLTLSLFISLSLSQLSAQSTNIEGVVIYNFHTYGNKTYESYLYFKEGQYRYIRHQQPEEVEGEETITYYYYKEHWGSYYLTDEDSILEVYEGEYSAPLYAKSQKQKIEWQITTTTKRVGDFTAQKAIAKPHDEDYNNGYIDVVYGNLVAWFVAEIPIPLGPEGYSGLPGLIVELEYEGGNVGLKPISLNKISYEEITDWEIPTTNTKVKVTRQQLYNQGLIDKKWLKREIKKLKDAK